VPRCDYLLLIYFGLGPIICYPLVDCLVAPATCGAIANCLCILVASSLSCSCLAIASPLPPRRLAVASLSPRCRLAVASLSPRCRLAPPFARHHHHHHVCSRHPTRTVMATAIAIGIVGRYPYQCCCHHRCRSSCRRLRCLRRHCPDVSVAPDAPVAPPLPPSFVTNLTAVRLRLATVPRHQRCRRRRRRRSATDATALTSDAAWTTPTSAWRTGSSSALAGNVAV